ncbi:MAG: hypothetical protein HYY18_00755 [Planctomycetes bacterium]|nr:hypothetical protein [Planctomycetota bacterium]
MSEAPVVDASPLIHLATAGLIELLMERDKKRACHQSLDQRRLAGKFVIVASRALNC